MSLTELQVLMTKLQVPANTLLRRDKSQGKELHAQEDDATLLALFVDFPTYGNAPSL